MAKGMQILSEEILENIKGGLPKAPTQTPTQPLTQAEGATPIIEGSFHGSLEEAANLLLSILPNSIKDYVNELADITLKIPRWQLLLGSLMAQQESGSLAAPSIDPAWRQVEALIESTVCLFCKQPFQPKRFGQKYCSTKCGDEARRIQIAEMNKRRDAEREAEKKAMREAGLPTI